MAVPLSLQLYTVRHAAAENFPRVLEQIAAIGYAGVEPAGFHSLPHAEFKRIVDDFGLQISGAHSKLPDGENANAILDAQEAIGNTMLICSFLREEFESEDRIKRAADRFSAAAAGARQRGIRLGYHNHNWEFDRHFDGRTGFDIFMAAVDPAVFAEIDIYWVQTGGHDPAALIRRLGARAPLIHVKDGPCIEGQPMTAVGDGRVDIHGALTASDAVKWHVVEIDDCATDMMEAVRRSYEFLTTRGYSAGRK